MASVLNSISSFFNRTAESSLDSLQAEQTQLFAYKTAALSMAGAAAEAEGRKPTLDDYWSAAQTVGEANGLTADTWNPRVIADLSGQTLNGFQIHEEPKDAHHGHAMSDSYDQDGDGQINAAPVSSFYDNIRFDGANLKDCFIDPATSFNAEIAKAAQLDGLTFNGMTAGDQFTFGRGSYSDIKMTNINGGDVTFDGSKVDGLDIQGAHFASITIGAHTSISNLNANHASIVSINATPGAEINHASFDGATIGMESTLAGTRLSDVSFKDTNLQGVDFNGVSLTNARFDGAQGMSFAGAVLRDVSFTNVDMDQLDLTGARLAGGVTVNDHPIKAPGDLAMFAQLDRIRDTMQAAVASIGGTSGFAEEAAPAYAAAPASSFSFSSIRGGENVSLGDVSMGTAVASLERTVPLNEQATAANMQVSGDRSANA